MKKLTPPHLPSYKKLFLAVMAAGIAGVLLLVLVCNLLILSDKKYVLPASSTKHVRVGLVLGAGITKNGKPYKELQARLDVAAAALKAGKVDKLVLSGDNRFKNYDEPAAMKEYLVTKKGIKADTLQPDYAGRSTYESCERAHKVFGLRQVIIYSANSHLPRAIYLCRHFGIEAYGVSSGLEANNAQRREVQARVKAIYNSYLHGEKTVLGKPIKI